MVLFMSNQKFHHIINQRLNARDFAQTSNQKNASALWILAVVVIVVAYQLLKAAGVAS